MPRPSIPGRVLCRRSRSWHRSDSWTRVAQWRFVLTCKCDPKSSLHCLRSTARTLAFYVHYSLRFLRESSSTQQQRPMHRTKGKIPTDHLSVQYVPSSLLLGSMRNIKRRQVSSTEWVAEWLPVLGWGAVLKFGIECNAWGSFWHHSDPHLPPVNHVRILQSNWKLPVNSLLDWFQCEISYVCIS